MKLIPHNENYVVKRNEKNKELVWDMDELAYRFRCIACGSTEGVKKGSAYKCRYCGVTLIRKGSESAALAKLREAFELCQIAKYSDAMNKYDEIIQENTDDVSVLEQAHYGRFLCEQQVRFYKNSEDRLVPSFFGFSGKKCQDSVDFKKALEYAQKSGSENEEVYRYQAKLIEDTKEIYNRITQREEYDIFICFKSGSETEKLGDELYRHFRTKYRVFYSKETLKLHGGEGYDAYIYNALFSARVLLVLCSSPDDINSQWVRNEWFRFSCLEKNDASKNRIIIPIIMESFKKGVGDAFRNFLPNELKLTKNSQDRQYIDISKDAHTFIEGLDKSIEHCLEGYQIKTPFDVKLDRVRKFWNSGQRDNARSEIVTLVENVEDGHYEDTIKALMLKALIYSNDYKHLKNATAASAIRTAKGIAKDHDLSADLRENIDYRKYLRAKSRKRLGFTLLCLFAALAIGAGGFGIHEAIQDPMTEFYITGNPSSIDVEYGEGVLSEISSITTVSKKGKKQEITLTSSMISGFDPTKIGVQDVVVTYNGMEIHLSVNVLRYTLSPPTELQFSNGTISWEGVQNAQSYTLKINDDLIENISANSYYDYNFAETGIYTVQVKANADHTVGMDSQYTDAITLVKLAQVSNLNRQDLQISWDAVYQCNAYDIYINGEKIASTSTPSYTFPFDTLSRGENLIWVLPNGAQNIKNMEELSALESSDYAHSGECKVYRYDQVSGISWDGSLVTWNGISGAGYAIYLNGELIARTEETSYSPMSQIPAGINRIAVVPEKVPNISDTAGTDYENNGTVDIRKLHSVSDLVLEDKKIRWSAVESATEYEILCNGEAIARVSDTSYSVLVDTSKPGNDVYTVRAYGDSRDIPSDVSEQSVSIGVLPEPTGLNIDQAVLTWKAVTNAKGYHIYADNELIETVDADTTSLSLLGKLKKGTYQVSVVAIGEGDSLLSSAKSSPVSYDVSETVIYISNEQELRNISLALDAIYVLSNDITLSREWTPLGSTATPFTGRLNGNGYSIINLSVTATSNQGTGLFGVVGKEGFIENLVIKDASCSGGTSYGSVGITVGINRGTLSNITVYGQVNAAGSDNVGGVVGRNYGSVYGCKNHATVSGRRYVGGVVGNCDISNFGLSFYDCRNDGEIQGNLRVGGIAGNVSVTKKTTIYGMRNEGTVTAAANYAGGIFGYIEGSVGQTAILNSCSNLGNITADDYASGCFGYTGSYVNVTINNINDTSQNCTNDGQVVAVTGKHTGEIFTN